MTRYAEITQGDVLIQQFHARQLIEPRELLKALGNKWFRLNVLYTIRLKEPMNGKLLVPFVPNAAQRQRYKNGHTRNLILKARQLGFTSFEMIDALDDCLFNPQFKAGCIAHTRDDANDIFDNKIKVAYESVSPTWLAIFESIGLAWPKPVSDQAGGYEFDNGSQISVGVSFRGGTLSRLHVSEFGKICRKFPDKAREIVTGAFEAVPKSGQLTIESTAEGREGYFFEYSQAAEKLQQAKKTLSSLDFQFHFFPWWQATEYRLPADGVIVTPEQTAYFDKLEAQLKQKISPEQRSWYVKKSETLGEDMSREYPSFPTEAFAQSVEGAYYAPQMTQLRKRGQIGHVPYDPRLAVYCAWDFGRNDSTAIWFFQFAWGKYRIIRYYENNGESLQFYLRHLRTLDYVYSTHFLPHDAEVTEFSQGDNLTRRDLIMNAGFSCEVVPRVPDKREAIQAVRDILPLCWFDETNCQVGIKALDSFQKEWDDKHGCWKDQPFRNWAKHGADAFEQFARGFRAMDDAHGSYEPDVV